jgi:putative membrane protein
MQRLHPAAIAVWMADSIARLGLGLVPLLALEGRGRLLLGALLVGGLIAPVLRWLRFTYGMEEAALVTAGGVLARRRRVIPLARIQSVDIVQKLRHRIFGVVELRIEVAGGSGTEAALVALTPQEAERIRARLLDAQTHPRDVKAHPVLARMETRDLLIAGVTGGRVAVVAVLLGYLQEFIGEDTVPSLLGRVESLGPSGIVIAFGSVIVFLLIAAAISLAATVLVYWDFTLEHHGDRLVTTHGLLERRRSFVPLHRIQAVHLDENLARRALGLGTLSVTVAGYAGPREEQRETSVLLPIGSKIEALELARKVIGAAVRFDSEDLEPAPPAALWRRLIVNAIVVVLITGVLVVGGGPLGALGLLGLGLAGLAARASWRSLGHRVDGHHVAVRSGALVRKTSVMLLDNIQDLSLKASPLQRISGLASLIFGLPRARPRALDLARPTAEARFSNLAAGLVAPTMRLRESERPRGPEVPAGGEVAIRGSKRRSDG